MLKYKSTIPFGVIGLGRFGFALAETLADMGKDVLVLDSNEDKINQIQDKVGNALVTPHLDKATLKEAGIQNCETVIVCIGEQIEISILTTLNVIELGVPRVISKAISAEHGKILKKIGAEVVYPERDRAIRLANSLTSSRTLDYIELSSKLAISEVKIPEQFDGKTIIDADLRKKFNLNIIAIVKDGEIFVDIDPDIILKENDTIVILGKKENINRFEKSLLNL